MIQSSTNSDPSATPVLGAADAVPGDVSTAEAFVHQQGGAALPAAEESGAEANAETKTAAQNCPATEAVVAVQPVAVDASGESPALAMDAPAPCSADGSLMPAAVAAEGVVGDNQAPLPLIPVVEAILFSSDMPLSAGKIAETVGLDSTKPVKAAIETLNAAYAQRQAAYRVEERAGGYQLLTLPEYAQYVQRLARKKR